MAPLSPEHQGILHSCLQTLPGLLGCRREGKAQQTGAAPPPVKGEPCVLLTAVPGQLFSDFSWFVVIINLWGPWAACENVGSQTCPRVCIDGCHLSPGICVCTWVIPTSWGAVGVLFLPPTPEPVPRLRGI